MIWLFLKIDRRHGASDMATGLYGGPMMHYQISKPIDLGGNGGGGGYHTLCHDSNIYVCYMFAALL